MALYKIALSQRHEAVGRVSQRHLLQLLLLHLLLLQQSLIMLRQIHLLLFLFIQLSVIQINSCTCTYNKFDVRIAWHTDNLSTAYSVNNFVLQLVIVEQF